MPTSLTSGYSNQSATFLNAPLHARPQQAALQSILTVQQRSAKSKLDPRYTHAILSRLAAVFYKQDFMVLQDFTSLIRMTYIVRPYQKIVRALVNIIIACSAVAALVNQILQCTHNLVPTRAALLFNVVLPRQYVMLAVDVTRTI